MLQCTAQIDWAPTLCWTLSSSAEPARSESPRSPSLVSCYGFIGVFILLDLVEMAVFHVVFSIGKMAISCYFSHFHLHDSFLTPFFLLPTPSFFHFSAGDKIPEFKKDAGFDSLATLDELRNAKGTLPTADIRMTMQKHMQDNAAVYRTQETLALGKDLIDQTVQSFKDVKVHLVYCVIVNDLLS